MSIYSAIITFVATQRTRRLRVRTAMRISELPRGVQKDIGWPDAAGVEGRFSQPLAICHRKAAMMG